MTATKSGDPTTRYDAVPPLLVNRGDFAHTNFLTKECYDSQRIETENPKHARLRHSKFASRKYCQTFRVAGRRYRQRGVSGV